jgi:hypothetical protein
MICTVGKVALIGGAIKFWIKCHSWYFSPLASAPSTFRPDT